MEGMPRPNMQLAETNDSNLETNPKPQLIYRCKKCRRIVAAQENIVPHERGQGEKCFKWRKRSSDLIENEPTECSSIFVEPMKWMQAGQHLNPIPKSYSNFKTLYVRSSKTSWLTFGLWTISMSSTRRSCGGEASMHGVQSSIGFLQLGGYAVQLWSLG